MGRGSWRSWPQVRGGLRRIQSLWQGTPAAVSQDPRLLSPGDHFGPALCLTVPTSGRPGSIQEAPAPCFPYPIPVPWSLSSASSLWMALEWQMPCGELTARESLSQREQLLPGPPQLHAQPRLILHHYDLLVLPSETLPRKELDSGTPGSIPQPSLFFLIRKMLHDTQSILLKRCAASRKVWGR